MAVERFTHLIGLEVRDPRSYAEYRARMTPILHARGGSFGVDLEVSRVLKGPHPALNRVFTISFPSRAASEAFFADPSYLALRREWFEPAVSRVERLAEWHGPGVADAPPADAT